MTKNPGGKSSVTPYVVVRGAEQFLAFVEQTFDVKASGRWPNPDGTIGHAEITVGESVLMTFDAQPDWPITPSFLSVYVDDVDSTCSRAVEAGGTVITELMESRITGDRGCRVKDPVGNIWWLQTHLSDVDPATIGQLFADPEEGRKMQIAQESFAVEMRGRS
ncbi:VOC family protein [Kribbella sp. NBC_01505]|uniref:VOC family protein n=1 Tax=Kribbella sp. NBC_01505 TaxID=2903580 RepID=UPI00386E538D